MLHAGESVDACVVARLEQPQRQRRLLEELVRPRDRGGLQLLERHDRVHEAPGQRRRCVVLPAQEPHLLGALLTDLPREQPDAVAAVERAHARTGLAEPSVVGRDREVAAQVQDVAAADRVSGHHREDRLGEASDLDLQVEHVQPTDALLVDVAVVSTDLLIAARGERVGAFAREDHDADLGVVARDLERRDQLLRRQGAEGVAHFRAVDRDLRDRAGRFVPDVGPLPARVPLNHMTINS